MVKLAFPDAEVWDLDETFLKIRSESHYRKTVIPKMAQDIHTRIVEMQNP
jgi:transposase-like protein